MENGTHTRLTIKDWAHDDRPREKMLRLGRKALSDAELLAIILGSGNRKETALDLAKRILLSCDHSLNRLASFSIKDCVSQFNGVGEAKAISILASLELGLRRRQEESLQTPKIKSAKEAYELFAPDLIGLETERFMVAYLSRSLQLIEKREISTGGKSATVVDVQMVIKNAVLSNANAILLAHNHPSGTLYPSESDRLLTRKISEAAKFLDMSVMDHIIIAGQGYYSFAEENAF